MHILPLLLPFFLLLVLVVSFDENERLFMEDTQAPKAKKNDKPKIKKKTLKLPGAVDMLKKNEYFDKPHPPLEPVDTTPLTTDEAKKNNDDQVKQLAQDRADAAKELIKQKKENKRKKKEEDKLFKNNFDIYGFQRLNALKRQRIRKRNLKFRGAYKIQQGVYREFVSRQFKVAKAFELEGEKAEHMVDQLNTRLSVLRESMGDFYERNQAIEQNIVHMRLDLDKHQEQKQSGKTMDQIDHLDYQRMFTIKSYCGQYLSCGQCIQSADCLWCREQQKCVLGDLFGPIDGACRYFSYGFCSEDRCLSVGQCQNCIQDTNCGWCVQTASCLEGNLNGPTARCPSLFIHKSTKTQGCTSSSDDDLFLLNTQLKKLNDT